MPYPHPVLIVDDDPLFRIVIVSALKALEVSPVYEAGDGGEVLSALDAAPAPIGLIFLDLAMPKVSGQTVIGWLADIGYHGDIIICSGETDEAIERAHYLANVLGLSIVGTLRKPISIEDVSKLLEQSQSNRQASSATAAND